MDTMMESLRALGLKRHADLEEIKRAYRQAALRYHPDSSFGTSDPERFRSATEAYRYLRETHCHSSPANQRQTSPGSYETAREEEPVDEKAVELSLDELINCVEHSPNPHVRQVSLETIAARREDQGYLFLREMLLKRSLESRREVIRALGQSGLEPATEMLIPLVGLYDLETSAAVIRSLERICHSNRLRIIKNLRREQSDWKNQLRHPLRFLKNFLLGSPSCIGKLGDLLIRTSCLRKDQLELALLLQKQFPLLLGQILRHLGYLKIADLQHAIALQRSYRFS